MYLLVRFIISCMANSFPSFLEVYNNSRIKSKIQKKKKRGLDYNDAILAELGNFLQKNIRGSDIACRYGGEEFMIILPDAPLEMTVQRAGFLREAVKELQPRHNPPPMKTITLSFGIAVFPEHGQTIEKLLKTSDTALYQAKKEGRNRICIAES